MLFHTNCSPLPPFWHRTVNSMVSPLGGRHLEAVVGSKRPSIESLLPCYKSHTVTPCAMPQLLKYHARAQGMTMLCRSPSLSETFIPYLSAVELRMPLPAQSSMKTVSFSKLGTPSSLKIDSFRGRLSSTCETAVSPASTDSHSLFFEALGQSFAW